MMKKTLIFSAAAALILASCSQDDFAPAQGADGNGNVTFTVSLNDKTASRAFGDGLSAQKLDYAVYDVTDADAPVLALQESANFGGGLSTTVSLSLAKGRNYKVAFFASNDGQEVYSFDAANKKVSVDYSKTHVSADQNVDNDCFYNTVDIAASDLGQALSVTLNRPVAQLNFGTGDLDNSSVISAFGDNLRTSVAAKGYTTLNLLDGSVEDEVDVESAVPSKVIAETDGSFPVDGYGYLHCTYILVPKEEKALAEVALTIYNGATEVSTLPVSNVPLQANYRTNIYGNLLTSPTDITITKDPNFDGEYNVEPLKWDGTVADQLPEINADNEMLISTPAELAKVAQEVNNGNPLAGVTLKLTSHLDLNSVNWTPIGTDANHFQGSFDGQNYTISNLTIEQKDVAEYAGLFGVAWPAGDFKNVTLDGVDINTRAESGSAAVGSLIGSANIKTISDVTVKNIKIRSYRMTGGVVGSIYGSVSNCKAENVDIELTPNREYKEVLGVKVPYWDNADKAGAIVGYDAEEPGVFENNSANNVKIKAYRDMAGLFGMVYKQTYSNNVASNITIIRTSDHFTELGGTLNKPNHGPVAGRIDSATDGGNNSFINYTYIDQTGKEQNWSDETAWTVSE